VTGRIKAVVEPAQPGSHVTPIDGRHLVFVCPTVGGAGAGVVNAFVSIEVLNLPSTEQHARVSRHLRLIL